jgi:hypothetical protein
VVDQDGSDLIEVVTHKTKAEYPTGYANAEYVDGLPKMPKPFFLGAGKYRLFPIEGDSMPPHNNSSFVIGQYLENLGGIRKNRAYILITQKGWNGLQTIGWHS